MFSTKKAEDPLKRAFGFYKSTWLPTGRTYTSIKSLATTLGFGNPSLLDVHNNKKGTNTISTFSNDSHILGVNEHWGFVHTCLFFRRNDQTRPQVGTVFEQKLEPL